jgi:bifunctional non-homologous end joining protein LigD
MQRVESHLFFKPPMECKEANSVRNIPRGDQWQYELKFDGYRCIAIKQNNQVELYSRRGAVFQQFTNIYKSLQRQPIDSFILDGEIVALDHDGASDFGALQQAVTGTDRVHFYAFDLLHCNGDNVMNCPLIERQMRLRFEFNRDDFLHIPAPLQGDVQVIVAKIQEFGFEGIIAKERTSLYQPGKASSNWIKMKLKQSDEFIVGGYIPGPNGIDQLVVGRFDGKEFKYVQALDDGFVPATRRKVHAAIKKFVTPACPFTNLPEKSGIHHMDAHMMSRVIWTKPKVIVEIAMNEWTPDHHLRHAEFRRVRDDKTVREVGKYPRKTQRLRIAK